MESAGQEANLLDLKGFLSQGGINASDEHQRWRPAKIGVYG